MDLNKVFEFCSGTTIGGEHHGSGGSVSGESNQDAADVPIRDEPAEGLLSFAICDGCSQRAMSGIGAALLSRIFQLSAETATIGLRPVENIRVDLESSILLGIQDVTTSVVGDNPKKAKQFVDEFFLSTIVGSIITPRRTLILACGDGVWGVNGSTKELGPFPGNEPPYLAYRIRDKVSSAALEVVYDGATHKLQNLFLGSDGCTKIPPSELAKFWREDRYFSNPALVSRELRTYNAEHFSFSVQREKVGENDLSLTIRPNWSERRLGDDTTLISVRRRKIVHPPKKEGPKAVTTPSSEPKPATGSLLVRLGLVSPSPPTGGKKPPTFID